MKQKNYIYAIVFLISIICLWNIYRKLIYIHDQKKVNSSIIFEDTYFLLKRDIKKDEDNPWKFPIKYYVEDPVSTVNVDKALNEIKKNTCINFEKQKEILKNSQGLHFKEDTTCSSYIGNVFVNQMQIIRLTQNCYKDPYTILHEIGHALGLVHEHARTDRDEYITIHYSNMDTNEVDNFMIRNTSKYKNYSTSYDFSAIMHYEQYAFATFWSSLFGWPVIESKLEREYSWMMGQHKKMTFNEFKQINLNYCNWCNWVDNETGLLFENKDSQTLCKNGGYPDFNNCSKCICPTGYTGDLCDEIITSDAKCGETNIDVNTTEISIILNDKMNCYFYLKAKDTKKVLLKVTYVNAPYKESICTEDVGYQFKYRKDKGATGLLLCGHHSRLIILKSELNDILIFYRGESGHSFMHFTFKEVD